MPTAEPPIPPRRRVLLAVSLAALAVIALWRLAINESAEEALATSGGEASSGNSVMVAPAEPTPARAEIPTSASPSVARPTCADFTSVQVTYQMVSETDYGIEQYRPRVTVVNGTAHPVEVTVNGWAKASNSIVPDFPQMAMWANHDLDVPLGGTGTVELGQRTGDYLGLTRGEEILGVHLNAQLRAPDASLMGQCEVDVVPS
ncbi:hypothetical protein [Blastococcus montanus]|uniref:hypothetical protein n=1 Tax=Blastococcus montanus TaxID=3144973 RepID=UPI0032099AC0